MTPMLRVCLASTVVITALSALDSITFDIGPGVKDYFGGMGKVQYIGEVTFTTVNVAKEHWIKSIGLTPSPDVMYNPMQQSAPCPNDENKFRTWPFQVVPNHTNADMLCPAKGVVPPCDGGGGSGDEPTFEATVVHVDFDVDSDNNTPQASGYQDYVQKAPSRDTAEDAIEEDPNGVLIPLNTGFLEGAVGPPAPGQPDKPIQDFRADGIDVGDPDLSVAKFEVKGQSGQVTFTFGPEIRIWRAAKDEILSGKSFAVAQAVAPNAFTYYIEGVAAGRGAIEILFIPDGKRVGKIDERVTYTVVKVELADENNRILPDPCSDERVTIRTRLRPVVTPNDLNDSAWLWTIADPIIKTYEHDIDEEAKHIRIPFEQADREKEEAAFFWTKATDPDASYQVQLRTTVDPNTTCMAYWDFVLTYPDDPNVEVYCNTTGNPDLTPNGVNGTPPTYNVLLSHENWHNKLQMDNGENPSGTGPSGTWGGVAEAVDGESFLVWHKNFLDAHKAWRTTFNVTDKQWKLPAVAPPRPTYLTINPVGRLMISPNFRYVRLGEFQNLDQLGRTTDAPWHNSGHTNMGGVMATLQSPSAPEHQFWLWHEVVDGVRRQWAPDVAKITSVNPADGARVKIFPQTIVIEFDLPVSTAGVSPTGEVNSVGIAANLLSADVAVGRRVSLLGNTRKRFAIRLDRIPPIRGEIEVVFAGTAAIEAKTWKVIVE